MKSFHPPTHWTQQDVKTYQATQQMPEPGPCKPKRTKKIINKRLKRIGSGKPGPGRKPKIAPGNVARALKAMDDDDRSYSIAKATPRRSVMPSTPASSMRATAQVSTMADFHKMVEFIKRDRKK